MMVAVAYPDEIAKRFDKQLDMVLGVPSILLAGWRDPASRDLVLRNAAKVNAGSFCSLTERLTPCQFLLELCRCVGVEPKAPKTAEAFHALAAYAKGPQRLLVIDNADLIPVKSVTSLIQLHKLEEHNYRKWPMVWASGDPSFFVRMHRLYDDSYLSGHCVMCNPDGFDNPIANAMLAASERATDAICRPILKMPNREKK